MIYSFYIILHQWNLIHTCSLIISEPTWHISAMLSQLYSYNWLPGGDSWLWKLGMSLNCNFGEALSTLVKSFKSFPTPSETCCEVPSPRSSPAIVNVALSSRRVWKCGFMKKKSMGVNSRRLSTAIMRMWSICKVLNFHITCYLTSFVTHFWTHGVATPSRSIGAHGCDV